MLQCVDWKFGEAYRLHLQDSILEEKKETFFCSQTSLISMAARIFLIFYTINGRYTVW